MLYTLSLLLMVTLFLPTGIVEPPVVHLPAFLDTVCRPGEYVINASGTFICLPERFNVTTPFVTTFIVYNSSGVHIYVASFIDVRSCKIDLWSPNMTHIKRIDVGDLPGGSFRVYSISVPAEYKYIVYNISVNNYTTGFYVVSRKEKSLLDIQSIASARPELGVILSLAVVAPLLGIALRGKPREAGLGLMGFSILYMPLMSAFGLPSPLPEFITTITFFTGLLLVVFNIRG